MSAPTLETVATPTVTVESPDERRRRLRLGAVFLVLGVLGLVLALTTESGAVRFSLADGGGFAFPAKPAALALSVFAVVVAAVQLLKGFKGGLGVLLFALFGVAFIVTFICWAAAGENFPLTNQIDGTMRLATPLILGALAGVCCERAGVINIAIEGQFVAGAFAGALVGSITQNQVAGLIGAIFAGVLVAAMLAVFAIRYLVNQIVLGVVLVVFATGITGFLYDAFVQTDTSRYNEPGVLSKLPIPGLSGIPVIGPIFNQTALVYLMYLAVPLLWLILFKTRWGLRVRAVGEHPRAADTVGIKVLRTRYQAVLLGGVFSGLGGAYFTLGSVGSFDKDIIAGNGFIALAAVIMGRWHPLGATLAALFFGFTTQLGSQLQGVQTPIPDQFLNMVPYIATLIAVAGLVGRVRPPKADGQPYTKE